MQLSGVLEFWCIAWWSRGVMQHRFPETGPKGVPCFVGNRAFNLTALYDHGGAGPGALADLRGCRDVLSDPPSALSIETLSPFSGLGSLVPTVHNTGRRGRIEEPCGPCHGCCGQVSPRQAPSLELLREGPQPPVPWRCAPKRLHTVDGTKTHRVASRTQHLREQMQGFLSSRDSSTHLPWTCREARDSNGRCTVQQRRRAYESPARRRARSRGGGRGRLRHLLE